MNHINLFLELNFMPIKYFYVMSRVTSGVRREIELINNSERDYNAWCSHMGQGSHVTSTRRMSGQDFSLRLIYNLECNTFQELTLLRLKLKLQKTTF